MSRRVTRPPDPEGFSSLRDRNPMMWWVAVVTIAALVLTTIAGVVSVLLA